MEPATVEDLERASAQGTILAVKMNGKTYGKGGIHWHEDDPKGVLLTLTALVVAGLLVWLSRKYKTTIIKVWKKLQSRRFHKNLRKAFFDNSNDDEPDTDDLKNELSKKKQEIEELEWELQQEHAIREMEWERSRKQHLQSSDKDVFIDEILTTDDDESSSVPKNDDVFSDEHTTDDEGTESGSSVEGGGSRGGGSRGGGGGAGSTGSSSSRAPLSKGNKKEGKKKFLLF